MLNVFLTSLLLFSVNCEVVVFFGTYEEATNCTIYTNLNWVDCVIQCNNTPSCYFAYSNPCGICGYGNAAGVTFTNISTDSQLAIKTEPGSNCTETSELLKEGNIDAVKKCQDGFTKYVRESSTICTQFVSNSGLYIDFTTAEEKCEALNATIRSPETSEDMEIMAAYAYNISKLVTGIVPAVWVGSVLESTSTTTMLDRESVNSGSSVTSSSVYNMLLGSNMTIISVETSFEWYSSTFCPVAAACGKSIW